MKMRTNPHLVLGENGEGKHMILVWLAHRNNRLINQVSTFLKERFNFNEYSNSFG